MNYTKSILYIFVILTLSTYAACPDNCDDCDDTGSICFTCSGDFQVNVLGGCHANTIDKCVIYGPTDQCFRCQPTYTLANGKCEKIYTGCVNEGNPNQCFQCAFGLTLSGTSCSGVINCADFSGGKCNKCREGYTLTGNKCKDTSIGCAETRPADGICNKCKSGFFQSGYQCIDNKTKNNRCYIQDFNAKCLFCKSGYNGIQGKCLLNKELMDYPFGSPTFNSPATESFESKTSQINDCQVPDPSGKGCIVCVYGWFPKNDGCEAVSPICDGHNVQNGQCFACKNQLTLAFGKCIDKNCDSTKNNICQTCKKGYKPNQNGVCKIFDPNCVDSQKGRCQQCKPGFYIDLSGLCKQLPPFCIAANIQTGNCLQCVKDYQLISPGAPCTKKIVIENCQVLDNKNIGKCLICVQRYFPDDKKCTRVSNLCKDYNPQNGRCNSCALLGFTLDNGKCVDINCVSRNNDDSCLTCKTNFIFNNVEKICKLNDPNCKTLTISSCQQCKVGFYITSQNICRTLPANCQNADLNGRCIACIDRFFNSGSSCAPVSPTCNTYNPTTGRCTSCNTNLVLQPDGSCATPIVFTAPSTVTIQQPQNQPQNQPQQSGSTQRAQNQPQNQPQQSGSTQRGGSSSSNTVSLVRSDLNCRQYSGNSCIRCSNRYYVGTDGRCVPVNPLCRQANSVGQCTSCYPGYRIDTGRCIVAPSTDVNCKSFRGQQCTQCFQGFYYHQNDRICKRLNPLCKTSNIVNGSCTSCYNGYNVNPENGNCEVFFRDPNCKQFKPDGGCRLCSNRYFINTNSKCTAANPLCRQFNPFNGSCTSCYPSYGLNKDNVCAAGVSNDPNCRSQQGGSCRQCISGFYLSEGKCKQASPLCKTFDRNNGNCLTCYNGYAVSNGTCIISQTQDPNCRKYEGQSCQGCYQGYILVRGQCLGQNPLCKTIDSATGSCTSCWTGYSLTADSNCALQKASQNPNANDPYCIQVTDGVCTQCSSGYYYNREQGVCTQFDPICRNSDTNTGACTSCYQGYVLSNTQCVVAPTVQLPNCLTPGSNNQCLQCVEGYYLNKEKSCTQVSILCAGYNKQTGDCTGCVAGHFLQDNACVYPSIFDQNCIRYENSYCSRCRPGFYLTNYVCQAIDPNCVNFNFNTSNCDTCANNLFANGPNCQ